MSGFSCDFRLYYGYSISDTFLTFHAEKDDLSLYPGESIEMEFGIPDEINSFSISGGKIFFKESEKALADQAIHFFYAYIDDEEYRRKDENKKGLMIFVASLIFGFIALKFF